MNLEKVVFGAYFNQGECCVSGTRLLVEDSVADQFVERLVERSRSLRVGDPTDEATDIGALIHEGHVEKVRGYIRQGEEEGARLLTGGAVLQEQSVEVDETLREVDRSFHGLEEARPQVLLHPEAIDHVIVNGEVGQAVADLVALTRL